MCSSKRERDMLTAGCVFTPKSFAVSSFTFKSVIQLEWIFPLIKDHLCTVKHTYFKYTDQ